MVFTTDGFFEVAIESWSEWDLNTRPLNSGFWSVLSRLWTEYLCISPVFSPNAGKYEPEKLRIRTLFTQIRWMLILWKLCNHQINGLSRLLPQWLCGLSVVTTMALWYLTDLWTHKLFIRVINVISLVSISEHIFHKELCSFEYH